MIAEYANVERSNMARNHKDFEQKNLDHKDFEQKYDFLVKLSEALVNILLPKHMNLPSHTEIPEIMTEFVETSGFTHVGAIEKCWGLYK